MNLVEIWEVFVANGWSTLGIAVVVFLLVWMASWLDLLDSGGAKRIGVLVSTYLLSGYEPGDIEEGITFVFAAVAASLINEFKEFVADKRD